LLLFSVLFGVWVANFVAFDGDTLRELAAQFLTLAEKQGATVPLMIGHRITGFSLLCTGDVAESRAHSDRALALYDPAEHSRLATRFSEDTKVVALTSRSLALWMLGYPESALADADQALEHARQISQVTLMYALAFAGMTNIRCRDYATATAKFDEIVALADQTGALFWKVIGMLCRGCTSALTGKASDAVHTIPSVITAYRSAGSTILVPFFLSCLTRAYAELGQFNDARRCIREAMTAVETTKETWNEAEVHRTTGEIALLSPEPDAAKAQVYFERALAVAQTQQARSFELRAATSLARLWRDQGKRTEAHGLLAPVYGWFTEGFGTPDLREAKALLKELA